MKIRLIVAAVIIVISGLLGYVDVKTDQVRLGGDTPPTIVNCGTAPSVSGFDNSGTITVGSGTVTSCGLNFSRTYGTAPVCLAVGSVASTNVAITSVSTSAVVFGFSASMPAGKVYYRCNAI